MASLAVWSKEDLLLCRGAEPRHQQLVSSVQQLVFQLQCTCSYYSCMLSDICCSTSVGVLAFMAAAVHACICCLLAFMAAAVHACICCLLRHCTFGASFSMQQGQTLARDDGDLVQLSVFCACRSALIV